MKMRGRADSDLSVSSPLEDARLSSGMLDLFRRIDVELALLTPSQARTGSVRTPNGPPSDSPYPWSQRPLQFSASGSPFPRYGAAVNAAASKEGWIYMMGGLVNSQTVKGDLWMIELATGQMACYPVTPASEGPCPRVGHSSLLVGNAFIVFGGDTKVEEGDVLDDTLYLLNTGMFLVNLYPLLCTDSFTATKAWSRASPAGPKPPGRYGHTLNILGSKLYIFGGQVEGYFFNDLVAFDLNSLQSPGNRWEIMIPDRGANGRVAVPPPRTNHSVVTWQDKLYLFGGTDGNSWFNDVWTYDPSTNAWSELDCIGYIPTAREGHAAALVNDTMYIFGGRIQDGTDLGDLAAFRISTRRWYMFQNMGPSPSPRSGHSMTTFGKHIIVLGGEPSSAPRDSEELSIAYILDTSKIRYPPADQQNQQMAVRKVSGDRPSASKGTSIPVAAGLPYSAARTLDSTASPVNGVMGPDGSRLPRTTGNVPSGLMYGPQNMQQPRSNGGSNSTTPRSRTPTKGPSPTDTRNQSYDRETAQSREYPSGEPQSATSGYSQMASSAPSSAISTSASRQGSMNGPSRSGSRQQRQQESIDSTARVTPRASVDQGREEIREVGELPVDSGVGSSPALSQQNDELMKELEAAKSRNAWYAAELALARKAGYQASSSGNPLLDQQAADAFADDDRPLIEALLKMRAELARIQGNMDAQAEVFANKVAEVEKQRDAAINEAAYSKARLVAQNGSQAGTPQLDMPRSATSPDVDRVNEISKRLAAALDQQQNLKAQFDLLATETENERRARMLAEETIDTAQKRVSELENYRQRDVSEVESLRAQLHEAERQAREAEANCAEAVSSSRSIEVRHRELSMQNAKHLEDKKSYMASFQKLQEALNASTEKADVFERKHSEEQERALALEQKHVELKSNHENVLTELESLKRRLRDSEELGDKHASEARTHREAVLSGLDSITSRSIDMDEQMIDERVTLLRQQLDSANAVARKNQVAADNAADRVRSAEERIAGLEAYQEQASRESLTIRKQFQQTLRDVRDMQQEKNELLQGLERAQLEKNALEVQYKTLKNLLEERGMSASDVRRSRALDSPSSRYGTPELNKVRELERQLDEALKAHEELRVSYEQREQEVSREWEDKLAALDNDHQGAVKYVRGLEKMLAKMKQELQKTKSANIELEKEIAAQKASSARDGEKALTPPPDWQNEREQLRTEMQTVKTSIGSLESQIASLKSSLSSAEQQRDALVKAHDDAQAQHQSAMQQLDQSAHEIEALRQENAILSARANDAESRVKLFLDQFETSVDNYRRQSRQQAPPTGPNGVRHGQHESIGNVSLYSTTTAEEDDDSTESGQVTPSAPTTTFPSAVGGSGGAAAPAQQGGKHERDRSSTALDSLASELDALRTHWETTNKNYRLSDKFEFERSPLTPTMGMGGYGLGMGLGGGPEDAKRSLEGGPSSAAAGITGGRDMSESLASWRKRLEEEGDDGKEKA